MRSHLERFREPPENLGTFLPAQAESILLGRRGSHAHGTYLPPEHAMGIDDEDWFVVYRFPKEFYLGMDGYYGISTHCSHIDKKSELDIVGYDIRKFLSLLIKGNPNVHTWLWAHPDDIFITHRSGEELITSRELFLSRRIFTALAGYAQGQFNKMNKPSASSMDNAFMGEKRRKQLKQYGYRIKNGAHCIRLLIIGEVLARTGELPVRLEGDALDIVLAIKMGEVPLKDFLSLFEQYKNDFQEAEQTCNFLPDIPDISRINEILLEALDLC